MSKSPERHTPHRLMAKSIWLATFVLREFSMEKSCALINEKEPNRAGSMNGSMHLPILRDVAADSLLEFLRYRQGETGDSVVSLGDLWGELSQLSDWTAVRFEQALEDLAKERLINIEGVAAGIHIFYSKVGVWAGHVTK
jgi:hypothetical protein